MRPEASRGRGGGRVVCAGWARPLVGVSGWVVVRACFQQSLSLSQRSVHAVVVSVTN